MRTPLLFHLPIALFLLFFSLLGALYEGSNIVNNPFEWDHSAHFSNLFNGSSISKSDISQLDFFIYASKFYPFFPILLLLSLLYLITIIGVYAIKDRRSRGIFFHVYTVCLLVGLIVILMQHIHVKYYYASILFVSIGVNCLLNYRNYRRV